MMKRSVLGSVVVCLVLSGVVPVLAQEPAGSPPRVLQIFREEVKPGKGAAHERVEVGWPRAFAKANSTTHYLAMTSVSRPTEAWFITGYDSLAAWEKDNKDNDSNAVLTAELQRLSGQDGELLSGVRSVVASYREDLSYRPNGANIGQSRYFYVRTVRVRPGREAEFEEVTKMARAAHESASVPEHWAVFQVNYGLPSGTFLVFQPLKSLAEVDAFPQTHGKTYQDAIGEAGAKKIRELNSAAVISAETNIFAFSPKMSYVSKEMAAADPDFWTPKSKAAMKPAAKKEGGKPALP